ncbi:MAG: hypothetical protein WKF84_18465 [Pyrinomonadaceae bacterium]
MVRAGYGITQYMEGTGSNLRLPLNPPFFAEADVTFDQTTGPGSIAAGFTDVIVRDQPAGLLRIWNPDLRPQCTQQWNGALEYQLTGTTSLTASYVGHKATHLVAPTDFNQALPDPGDPLLGDRFNNAGLCSMCCLWSPRSAEPIHRPPAITMLCKPARESAFRAAWSFSLLTLSVKPSRTT